MPKLDTSDGVLQVLTLCNFFRLSTALHPGAYTEDGIDSTERVFLMHLRKKSKELISYLESWLEITNADACVVALSVIERLYALQQAHALQVCLARSLSLGLKSPIEGLTLEALNSRLAGCFENKVFENEDDHPATDASFYFLEKFLVQRRVQPLFASKGE